MAHNALAHRVRSVGLDNRDSLAGAAPQVTFASRGGEAVNGREIHTSVGFVLAIPLTLVVLSAQQSRIAFLQLHQHVHGNDARIAHPALGFAQPGYNVQRHY